MGPVPRGPTLHNVIGVGDVTSDQQTAPAASTALESKTTAAYMWGGVRKLAEWPQGWRTARTWLTTASLGAVAWWWTTVIFFVLAGQPGRPVLLLAWNVEPATLNPAEVTGLVIAGVLGVLAWPGVLQVVPAVDAALGQGLLGPSRTSQLSSEVVRLSKARSLAVESAEAERRRIERDLHDGLQPELVNLALDLGLAKARSRTDPEGAWSLVERAHEDAKRAAADLRNLVRGIHPSVLDERGLDAALSGLVASCTVPVSVKIDLPSRPPPI